MDFGLTGEDLGLWKGVAATAAAFIILWAFWPDIKRVFTAVRDIVLRKKTATELQVLELRKVAESLPQKPPGTDGTTYAKLPAGTNIVTLPDKAIRLALPVRISGIGTTSFGSAASASLRKVPDDD